MSKKEKRAAWLKAKRRAWTVCEVAISLRRHHLVPTIRALARHGAITDIVRPGALPYPSQERLAQEIGRCERTVRRHVLELQELTLIERWVPPVARLSDGTFTRATTRYLLRDRAWEGFRACPLRRRRPRSTPSSSPTGQSCPENLLFEDEVTGGPVDYPPSGDLPVTGKPGCGRATEPIATTLPWEIAGVTRQEWLQLLREGDV